MIGVKTLRFSLKTRPETYSCQRLRTLLKIFCALTVGRAWKCIANLKFEYDPCRDEDLGIRLVGWFSDGLSREKGLNVPDEGCFGIKVEVLRAGSMEKYILPAFERYG